MVATTGERVQWGQKVWLPGARRLCFIPPQGDYQRTPRVFTHESPTFPGKLNVSTAWGYVLTCVTTMGTWFTFPKRD